MNAQTTEGLTRAYQIDRLLSRLQGTVREPTFSYRLEEIRAIVIQLVACWTTYRRGEQERERCEEPAIVERLSDHRPVGVQIQDQDRD
jgi:hypothetical protein